jgi:6-phosphogluconolactonase (cycloisomerase 2 family)
MENSGTIENSTGYGIRLDTGGKLFTLKNTGTITGFKSAILLDTTITNPGSGELDITLLENRGTIDSTTSYGIDIEKDQSNIVIGTITNYGSITGLTGGIRNNTGTITTLNNSQSSQSSQGEAPLIYVGKLPSNYNIIVYNQYNYGQLSTTSCTGTMNFNIHSSNGATGIFTNVLQGFSSENITGKTGTTTSGYKYSLIPNSSTARNWDLIISDATTAPNISLSWQLVASAGSGGIVGGSNLDSTLTFNQCKVESRKGSISIESGAGGICGTGNMRSIVSFNSCKINAQKDITWDESDKEFTLINEKPMLKPITIGAVEYSQSDVIFNGNSANSTRGRIVINGDFTPSFFQEYTNRSYIYGASVQGSVYQYRITPTGLVDLSPPFLPTDAFYTVTGNAPHIIVDPLGRRWAYSTYAGIRQYTINSDGTLTEVGMTPVPSNSGPWWLASDPQGRYLYGVNGGVGGNNQISVFSINPVNGVLSLISTKNQNITAGTSDRILVDPTGKYVFTTNQSDTDTNLHIYPIQAGGSLGTESTISLGSSSVTSNNETNSYGMDISRNGYLYVCNASDTDLIANQIGGITIYKISAAGILDRRFVFTDTRIIRPTNIIIHPNGLYAYVTCLTTNFVYLFNINQTTGNLSYTTQSYDFNASVYLAIQANYLFIVQNTSGRISQCRINPDGTLVEIPDLVSRTPSIAGLAIFPKSV